MVSSANARWNAYYAHRDAGLKDELVLQYAPLVKYVVGRLAIGLPNILDFEDVLSYGTLGLIEAVDRFDPSKGVKFETYAIARIRGSIIDALRAVDRLPRSVRQKARQIEKATNELEAELGRPPTDAEIASRLDVSVERYQGWLIDASWATVSLDGLLDSRDYGQGGAQVELPDAAAHEEVTGGVEREELGKALAEAIRNLPSREQLVVALYYQDEMTMKEISHVLEISESRVCQLHAKAVSRLRSALNSALD